MAASQQTTKVLDTRMRQPPPGDNQPDFFIPVIYDVPIKDELGLMDIAPYRLSNRGKANVIEYEVKDAKITIRGAADIGLATVHDYDLVIHMISYLNAEMERYRRGERDTLPERKYRPGAHEIIKFLRRRYGGEQYKLLELSLQRLNATTITIVAEGGARRKSKGFSLINNWEVLSKTKTGKIQQIEITYPDWLYDGIVRDEKPSVLTLHKDYFLVSGALDRSLYRLARKTAGKRRSSYALHDVYHRSGSTQPRKDFFSDLRKAFPVKRCILEYDFEIIKAPRGERLEMTYQNWTEEEEESKAPALFSDIAPGVAYEAARKLVEEVALSWDANEVIRQWIDFAAKKGVPNSPMGSLRKFAQFKQDSLT